MKSIVARSLQNAWINTKRCFPTSVNCLFTAKLMAYNSPVDDAFLNWVWADDLSDKTIKELDQFFDSPYCYYLDSENPYLMNLASQYNLIPIIKYRQFKYKLNELSSEKNHIKNFEIKLLDNSKEILTWANTFCAGYKAYNGEYIKKFIEPFFTTNNLFLVLGLYNNIPVSTGMLFINEKIAGIFGVATIENYRSNGFAKAIINKLLHIAKANKCQLASLNSTPNADLLYRKIGFKPYIEDMVFLPKKYVDKI